MNKRAIKFRDVWVAPGSECFAALEAGQVIKAMEIVMRCERERMARELNVTVDELNRMLAVRNTSIRDSRLPPNMC